MLKWLKLTIDDYIMYAAFVATIIQEDIYYEKLKILLRNKFIEWNIPKFRWTGGKTQDVNFSRFIINLFIIWINLATFWQQKISKPK